MAARLVSIILGLWLFASSFLWPHPAGQVTNNWLCAIFTVVFALLAFIQPRMRYLGAALAVWVFVSAFVLTPRGAGTVWNNALTGVALFACSLVSSPALRPRSQEPPMEPPLFT